MDGEQPGMTMYLNLLAEEAEEALRKRDSFEAQKAAVLSSSDTVEVGPMRSFVRRLAQRRSG